MSFLRKMKKKSESFSISPGMAVRNKHDLIKLVKKPLLLSLSLVLQQELSKFFRRFACFPCLVFSSVVDVEPQQMTEVILFIR